jgi:hypothetical protein
VRTWSSAALVLVTCSCAPADTSDQSTSTPAAAAAPRPTGYPKFALGVRFAEKGLAAPFGDAGAGIKWARVRFETFAWGTIEKKAPVAGKHTYDWSCPDALVSEYQNAGLRNLQAYISPRSSWGTTSSVDQSIKSDQAANYRAFVQAMIERYDGDGNADMPGLRAPVRYWVVGTEWTPTVGFGTSDDYIAFLSLTRQAARAAWNDVQLGAVPFLLFDAFEGDEPTDLQIHQRVQDPPPSWRMSTLGLRAILARPELFDYVDLHSVGDYSELPPMLRWLRSEMKSNGYEKPIWIDEATPIAYLVTPKADLPAIFPVTQMNQPAVAQLLLDVAHQQEPAYSRAVAWMQAQVAIGLVKKVVVAMAGGAVGIQMGSTEDMLNDASTAVRDMQVQVMGSAAMSGLIDVRHDSYEPCLARRPLGPRPALTNLTLLAQKLGPASDGAMVAESTDVKTARVFRYDRAGRSLWIAWNDDHLLHLPDDPAEMPALPTFSARGAGRVRVTRFATSGAGTPRDMTVADDAITLSLTSVPVLVEPM